jgi:hypothetical protein
MQAVQASPGSVGDDGLYAGHLCSLVGLLVFRKLRVHGPETGKLFFGH